MATVRGSGFMPQSVESVTRSARHELDHLADARAATCSGVSTIIVRMSSTPTCDLLVGRQVREELDVGHVAVGEVEHELVDPAVS